MQHFDVIELGDAATRRRATESTPVVLRCEGVVKRFGGVRAVDDVSIEVAPGEIVGLIGQNGAGKTTLLDVVTGLQPADEGIVEFLGRDVTGWSTHRRALAGLGRSFQEARLFPSLTVAETLAVACERHVRSRSLVADALRQPASLESELATSQRVARLLDLIGMRRHATRSTAKLSTGMRRIVELGCLLAAEPAVLLLDEPSAGVAQRETEALGPILERIRDRTGAAMLIIEHDMGLVGGVADRLVALDQGRVIANGAPGDVLTDPLVVGAYLGTTVGSAPAQTPQA